MEDHLIVSNKEHKVLKKFKTRLQNLHHVVINMPDTVLSSDSDVIFVSIVGEKSNRESVKKFLSEKLKATKEKVELNKNILTITLSDSEDSVSSDSESKENSVCVLEELACANNYPNLVKKSSMCNSLDNSVCIIDILENPPMRNINIVQNMNKRKRKFKKQKWRNKRARKEDNLKTIEADILEISSTTDVCEVSSTTNEIVKRAQPEEIKLDDFIPLGQKADKSKLTADKCGFKKETSDIILVKEPSSADKCSIKIEKNNIILVKEPSSDKCSFKNIILVKEPSSAPRTLRPIVIDGSNVAIDHGKVSHCFSAKGIKLAIEYFLKRGHTDVHAFVPKFRRISNPRHNFPTKNPEILDELAKNQLVVFTPSRRVNGKCIASYDDRFIVELASRNGGVIVSNDNYRDLIGESDSFKEPIEKRLLMFCFVGDLFMVPSDPLGRNGPSLDDFLSFPPHGKT